MPWYIFIHPLWQLVALYFGVKNLYQGFNRDTSLVFSIRKHINAGLVFITITILGYLIGHQSSKALRDLNIIFVIKGHRLLANITLILLALILLSGFLRKKEWRYLKWLQFLHPWFGLLTVGIIFAQLFLAISKFVGW
ncbi:MAG: hypothetical protein N2748_01355 [candidate division WOR-3 bacterium]|nr:hypothetical protein [candidate division WOR-3 bacterium]